MTQQKTWRFRNGSNAQDMIVVHDQKSADLLMGILKKIPGQAWALILEDDAAPAAMVHAAASTTPPPAPAALSAKKSTVMPHDERRQQIRHATEFRVILITGSTSFRTISSDISTGGMRLKKKIPGSFLNQKIVAYVSHEDMSENLELVCEVVGDPSDPCRVKFRDAEAKQIKRLEEWIKQRAQGRVA